MGIPKEHLSRLTERFYPVDLARSRVRGGTGLGLAIVKHVLERHGSELRIVSKSGQGITFGCEFPQERCSFESSSGG
jgi:two-component system phosphate regulon sensor histidine kinase PhoR